MCRDGGALRYRLLLAAATVPIWFIPSTVGLATRRISNRVAAVLLYFGYTQAKIWTSSPPEVQSLDITVRMAVEDAAAFPRT